MEARETTFETLLNGRVQYRVPLFQRQYAWQREQRQQLWSDIVDLYDERMAEVVRIVVELRRRSGGLTVRR